jgi:hypothetical protein
VEVILYICSMSLSSKTYCKVSGVTPDFSSLLFSDINTGSSHSVTSLINHLELKTKTVGIPREYLCSGSPFIKCVKNKAGSVRKLTTCAPIGVW